MTKCQSGRLGKQIAGTMGCVVVVILVTLIILFPFYWMIVTSFKSESEIYMTPPSLFPQYITAENYEFALFKTSIPIYFLNSIFYAVCTLLVVLIFASLAAYSMSRFYFRGKRGFLIFVLLSQLMPLTTLIVPLYVSFGQFGLINSRIGLIAIYVAIQTPIALWLLIGYFNSIPKEIDEAARIDGCSNFGILYKIILPLAKPGIMAVSLSVVIAIWQELMLAMTFTNVDSLRPLMAGVSAAVTKSGVKWGQINATGIITCIPIILLYCFCQKYLIKGLTGGAVKG